ncbi:MAG TPA: DNA methyltransferase [Ktedonobacteraceae bacterium]
MGRNRTSEQQHLTPQNQSDQPPEEMPHPRNTLNDMGGDRFLYFTKSVLSTSYPSVYSHELRKKHGANKPPQLMAQLIEFFTKTGMSVLDPFAGVGGTLIGASIAAPGARTCVGIEINKQWIDIYARVLKDNPGLQRQAMIQGDCIEVMDRLLAHESVLAIDGAEVRVEEKEAAFDFIVMDPPYNIHLAQTMSGNGGKRYAEKFANRRSDYNMRSENERDLANLATYEGYLDAMGEVFQRCFRLLRPGRYMAIIVRNAYQHSEYMFTHADLARRAKSIGFVPKGEIIWYQAGTKLRPYGYPSSYVPNIAHQYIVILQRPRKKK